VKGFHSEKKKNDWKYQLKNQKRKEDNDICWASVQLKKKGRAWGWQPKDQEATREMLHVMGVRRERGTAGIENRRPSYSAVLTSTNLWLNTLGRSVGGTVGNSKNTWRKGRCEGNAKESKYTSMTPI